MPQPSKPRERERERERFDPFFAQALSNKSFVAKNQKNNNVDDDDDDGTGSEWQQPAEITSSTRQDVYHLKVRIFAA